MIGMTIIVIGITIIVIDLNLILICFTIALLLFTTYNTFLCVSVYNLRLILGGFLFSLFLTFIWTIVCFSLVSAVLSLLPLLSKKSLFHSISIILFLHGVLFSFGYIFSFFCFCPFFTFLFALSLFSRIFFILFLILVSAFALKTYTRGRQIQIY